MTKSKIHVWLKAQLNDKSSIDTLGPIIIRVFGIDTCVRYIEAYLR